MWTAGTIPVLVTIAALRRRGYTPESLKMFVDLVGVSKANSSVDYAMLESCIREDLKLKPPADDGGSGSGEADH